jgi:hypothetical protein
MHRIDARPAGSVCASSRTVLTLALLASLAMAAQAAGAPAGASSPRSGVTLGERATIDAEVFGVATEADARQRLGSVAARSPDGEELARLRLRADHERVVLHGELPSLAGSALLAPITSEALWPCRVQVSGRARFLPARLEAEGLGVLLLATEPPHREPIPGEQTLVLVYADEMVSVRARCELETGPPVEVAVELLPGWNLLASEVVFDAEGERLRLRAATEAEIARARWYAPLHPPPTSEGLELERRGD